jgi:hypothetical protein
MDDLRVSEYLDLEVHDLGQGDRPSKKLSIADFALPRRYR